MPQVIMLQCGNQIGNKFWEMALQEHAFYNKKGIYDDSISTFFRNVDSKGSNIMSSDKSKIQNLRARGILVDMEEGVLNQISKSSLSELFSDEQKISSQSGCGNNWSVGYYHYGELYKEKLTEAIRKESEFCDGLQAFFINHSMGGGTGSGMGSFLLELLADNYPEQYKFNTAIFPGGDDDVITAPYNSMLALAKMNEFSDCVLPIENQAIFEILERLQRSNSNLKKGSPILDVSDKRKTFDSINALIANMILNLTSSMRFEGSMNVDINEISTNLVPFPQTKYLCTSISPLYQFADVALSYKKLDQLFLEAFQKENQFVRGNQKGQTYLACGLICRGQISLSDVRRNIEKIKKGMKFVSWNEDGWKTGLCSVGPKGQNYSILALSNNVFISEMFQDLKSRFSKLFKRKAHVHHYLEHMDINEFWNASNSLDELLNFYSTFSSEDACESNFEKIIEKFTNNKII